MKKRLSLFNRIMMAVTFAEADEGDIARQMLDPEASLDPSTRAVLAANRRPASKSRGTR